MIKIPKSVKKEMDTLEDNDKAFVNMSAMVITSLTKCVYEDEQKDLLKAIQAIKTYGPVDSMQVLIKYVHENGHETIW